MSISTEIARIQTNRNAIRAKLVELGMATNTANLDALAAAIEGLVNRGAVKIEVKEGETYNIPAGYHDGTGSVSGIAGGGNYTLQHKSVTPTKSQQAVTSDEGYYGLSGLTVGAIPDAYQDVTSVTATAGDVLVGKVYVTSDGTVVAGTMPKPDPYSATLYVGNEDATIPKGYHDGTETVRIVLDEVKTVTPGDVVQTIVAAPGKVLSKVIVNNVAPPFYHAGGADVAAEDVLSGKKFIAETGGGIGTMPNNGAIASSIDGLTTLSATIPKGYTSGGTVSLTGDIEEALASI